MVADRLDHLEFDAGPGTPGAEDFHIALPIMAEREVRSLNHAPRGELATDHPVEELAGGQVQQPATSVAPASSSRAISRSGNTRGTGALSGRSSATGCGSNVTARAGTPAASARARNQPIRR